MRKYSLMLLMSMLIFSCSQKQTIENEIIINGNITSAYTGKIYLQSNDYSSAIKDSVLIDNQGNFEFKVKTTKAAYYSLIIGNEGVEIFLIPGKNMKIVFEIGKMMSSMTFEGEGAVINTYLKEDNAKFVKLKMDVFSKSESEFLTMMNKLEIEDIQNYEIFKQKNKKASPLFMRLHPLKIQMKYLKLRKSYPSLHQQFNPTKDFTVNPEFYSILDQVNTNDTLLLEIQEGKEILYDVLQKKLSELQIADTLEWLQKDKVNDHKLKLIKQLSVNNKIQSYLMYLSLKESFMYYGPNGTDEILNVFNELNTNKQYQQDIEQHYNQIKNLQRGNLSKEIIYYDAKGSKHSINEYKGKYVYIDFWASWCQPCIEEIPYLQKISNEFKNKNIVFLSISIDDKTSIAKWKQIIKTYGLKNPQMIFDEAQKMEVASYFQITSIPRFLLIDPKGNIEDAFAYRPSNSGLNLYLNHLLEK